MSLVPTSRRPFQAMARHKGSVFGALGEEAQPSSEQLRKRSPDAGVGGFYPWMCIFQWSLDINEFEWSFPFIGLLDYACSTQIIYIGNVQFYPFVIGCVSSMDWCIYPWLPRLKFNFALANFTEKTRSFRNAHVYPSKTCTVERGYNLAIFIAHIWSSWLSLQTKLFRCWLWSLKCLKSEPAVSRWEGQSFVGRILAVSASKAIIIWLIKCRDVHAHFTRKHGLSRLFHDCFFLQNISRSYSLTSHASKPTSLTAHFWETPCPVSHMRVKNIYIYWWILWWAFFMLFIHFIHFGAARGQRLVSSIFGAILSHNSCVGTVIEMWSSPTACGIQ
jgi:hypothetical protein